jgi:hypothetical protein
MVGSTVPSAMTGKGCAFIMARRSAAGGYSPEEEGFAPVKDWSISVDEDKRE